MALLGHDGYGFWPVLMSGQVLSAGTPVAATGRDGVGGAAATGTNDTPRVKRTITPTARLFGGVAQKVHSGTFGSGTTAAIMFHGDTGATDHITLNWDAAGRIQVRRGTGSGAIIATSTHTPVISGSWVHIGWEVTIADAGGIVNVWLNGVQVITFTGDTKNAGTSTNIDAISVPAGLNVFSDDLYWNDNLGGVQNTFLGDLSVKEVRGNGNGASSQWVGSDGNSTDNYLLTDEVPLNTTDYVASSTAADRDLYAVADLTITGSVLAVQVHAYAQKTDAGARSLKTLQRSSGGTVVASSALPLTTTYGVLSGTLRTTDPDGAAWTVATVNSCQYGIENV